MLRTAIQSLVVVMAEWRATHYQTYDLEMIRVERNGTPVYVISWKPSYENSKIREELLGILKEGQKKSGLSDYFYLGAGQVQELLSRAGRLGCNVSHY